MQMQARTKTRSILLLTSKTLKQTYCTRESEQSCLLLFQTCNTLSKLTQSHAHITKLGLLSNPLVLTKFASTSSLLNSIGYASTLLFSPESNANLYDAFLFNTLIRSYALCADKLKETSILVYNHMLRSDVLPNRYTYPFLLKACAGISKLGLGKSVHGSVLKLGFDDDGHVLNTLVHMYCCCGGGGIDYAGRVFDEMPKTNSVAWSAMISGYVRWGRSNDAVQLFRRMQMEGVSPDEITMVSVLSACTDLGALELGKWVESYIEKEKVNKSVELCNSLIDMFSKCGDIDKAFQLFRDMKDRNIVSWTSVIVGLAMHGRGVEAISLFEEMIHVGIEPDGVVFIGVLSACSHSKLVEKGKECFDSMRRKFGVEPKIEHYGCMVDLLCRAGLLKDALEFVRKMPFEANPIIWRMLINACRLHGELKVGENITKSLISCEPMHESNYVLLSGIYAKMFQWDKKTKIREMMDRRGMKKIPGSTMIEVNYMVYEFVAGDKSHAQCQEIYEMVEEMRREIKRAGYVPAATEVTLDIDDEDKEDALNRHSEKLAIAFALLNTPPKTPIRITKNLRVCGDCHSATKFISKMYEREIIVRDRNRFHHFKDGSCSCGDFW